MSEESSPIPGSQSDVLHTLDDPRCMPSVDMDEKASDTTREMPGSTPDENSRSKYDANSTSLRNYAQMVSRIWPKISAAAANKFPEFARSYNDITCVALPNFLGAKISVPSGLNIQKWRQYLSDYHDQSLCEFLQYGWPIGYRNARPPKSIEYNHPSALAHMSHVKDFIKIELQYGALVGPFDSPPFEPWTRLSPIMTRSKKDSNNRQIIVDLSFPDGEFVNDGIDPTDHFGNDISYTLPTITDLVTQIQLQGEMCYLWKADLTRAYRQMRCDPADAPLLGIKIDSKIYVDRCPPFGCRSSASICQRMANSLVYIMANEGHQMIAYLDDFGGCHASKQKAQQAYSRFKALAKELGLQLADQKCCPPNTSMEWLGYQINTEAMSVTIPAAKLQEILAECRLWLDRRHATKTMIQQLVGKLIFLCNCVQQGRKFMARILATLRDMKDRQWTSVSAQFRADVDWFCKYAEQANGILLCAPVKEQFHLECDSSLYGAGGNSDSEYYTWEYSTDHTTRYPCIYQLEAVNIVVAYKTLADYYPATPTHVTIWTDNITSSFALQTGRTKDQVLGSCARELWLHASKRNHTVEINHKRGTLIPLADALSRLSQDATKASLAEQIIQRRRLRYVPPRLNNYSFFNKNL